MRNLIYLICILYGLSSWGVPPADPDLGWQLFGGAWIFDHGKLPSFDPINTFNSGWQDYHWLAQVFMYELFKLGSYPLLQLVFGLILAYTAKVIVDIVLQYSPKDSDPLRVLIASLIAIYCIHSVASVRPQMIAILGIALALRNLSFPETKWQLPYLFVLTAIVANCHVYWIFIPFLFFCFRVLPQLSAHTLTQGFVLCLAGLVSPYTASNYALLLDYALISPTVRAYIFELKSGLSADGFVPYVIIAICLLAFLLRDFRKDFLPRRAAFTAFLVSLFLTFRALKFLPILGLTCLPIVSVALYRLFQGKQYDSKFVKFILAAFLVHGTYFCVITSPWIEDSKAVVESLVPFEACSKIAQLPLSPSHGRDHVRLLTHFNQGGWCRWIIYQNNPALDVRVTTDGRTQWVKDEMLRDSFDLYLLKSNWAQVLKRWEPDAALVPKNNALGQFLSYSSAWKIAEEDSTFAVLLPRQ